MCAVRVGPILRFGLSDIFTLISSLFSGFSAPRRENSVHDFGQFLVEIEGLLGPEMANLG